MDHITFSCACGRTLRVKGEHAGKRTRCPGCAEPLDIPRGDKAPAGKGPRPKEERFRAGPPPPRRRRQEEEDLPTVLAADEDEDLPEAEPAPRRRRKRRRPRSSGGGSWMPSFDLDPAGGAVLGGLAMMLGAVVWFVLGLFVGIIFIYPPVLFIIGLLTFFGGVNGSQR